MTFKKILLATAITAVSSSAFALEAMDEASLSATTGQDGLTVTIDNAGLLPFDVIIHDTDGFTGRLSDGAIILNDITVGALNLTLDIDAGSDAVAGTDNTLQIKAYNTSAISVNMGTLQVANSGRDNAGAWGIQGSATDVMALGTINIGATSAATPLLNIQMGNEAQGAWMKLNPTLTTGLTLTNFALYDASASGAEKYGVGISTLNVRDNGGTGALTASVNIDATANGLELSGLTLGTGTGVDVRMSAVTLGKVAGTAPLSAPIGDVEIVGLSLSGTTISVIGH
jgi:hypothetical protein